MHEAGWYIDFKNLFSPFFGYEIQIGFTIRSSLEKKLRAIVSWVLNAWVFYQRCMTEFAAQSEAEEQLNMPVTPFMSGLHDPRVSAQGQVGFIEFVVLPLWRACSAVLSPPCKREAPSLEDANTDEGPASRQVLTDENDVWLENLHSNLEMYKYVVKHGHRGTVG